MAAATPADSDSTSSRRRLRRRPFEWVLVGLLMAGLLVAALGLYLDQDRQMARIRQSAAEADAKYAEALERNRDAHKTLDSIGTDEYIERIARDKLGMVKPGERILDPVD
jgi:cell division protein FtsB